MVLNSFLSTVDFKRQTTVAKSLARVVIASRGAGLLNRNEGCENETWIDWAFGRHFGCRHRGGCSSYPGVDKRYCFDELYGLYDYANCGSTVPAACCSVGSGWNRWLYDAQRLSEALNHEKGFDWTASRHSSVGNNCGSRSYSSGYLGSGVFDWGKWYTRVWSKRFELVLLFRGYYCYGSAVVSVADCCASVSGNCGVHDSEQLSRFSLVGVPTWEQSLNAPASFFSNGFLYYCVVSNSTEVCC
jgi:hypothetical protein